MAPSIIVARMALGGTLIWIAWQSLVPAGEVVASSPFDKVNHLVAYAALGLLAGLSIGRPSARRSLLSWCAVVGFGLVLEAGQAFTPSRSAEVLDLAADAVGAALGIAAVAGARSRRERRRQGPA